MVEQGTHVVQSFIRSYKRWLSGLSICKRLTSLHIIGYLFKGNDFETLVGFHIFLNLYIPFILCLVTPNAILFFHR